MASDPQFFSDLGSGVQSLGAGIGSFFASSGYQDEAASYQAAAQAASVEAEQAGPEAALKSYLQQRQAFATIGKQQATIGGGNLGPGGSGTALLKSSLQQSYLNTAMITQQGAINEQAYQAQAQSAEEMAKMAREQAGGSMFAGISDIIGSGFKFAGAFAGS